ncbi:hypothetical protein MIND_00792200 [Mycena indigotica]|uniref:F-box domain-containing protein n=1 Tax=Mycena indigotica TaxID=2126181 RepID=A0A8H6W269_9AGAR|nr:uncharacterized protein MIND_00792200 [Mycena indigotica]KAF7302252.1 hypothetical protein MIND_00792200 [Mycena indigotica]
MTTTLRLRIADLDEEIIRQRRILIELEAARDALQAELHRVSAYPILELPLELTAEIFLRCLPDSSMAANDYKALFNLVKVCKSWAHVAFATPALWRSLRLDVFEWEGEELVDVLSTGLRSGLLNLSISGNLTSHSHHRQLITTVETHSSQLSLLSFTIPPEEFPLLISKRFDLRQLRELRLVVREGDYEPLRTVDLKDVFVVSTELYRVFLDGIPLTATNLPWDQLTEFECRVYSPNEVLDAVALLPNLIRLIITLSLESADPERSPAEHQVTHTNLRHLSVSELAVPRHEAHMLDYFTLPNLETLVAGRIEESTLQGFLERSKSPPLVQLKFYDNCWDPYEAIFTSLPCLADLAIEFPSPNLINTLADLLTSDDVFLPSLDRISIEWKGIDGLDAFVELVALAVQTRNHKAEDHGSVKRIQSLALTTTLQLPEWNTLTIPAEYLTTYRELKNDGVHIHVGTPEFCFVNGPRSCSQTMTSQRTCFC